ncbi:uncharacterized protein LOC105803065 isoform X5 [Gossypium raimondii]|uniref:uncharacterized protein LOC105803065 isoform X5 n=1 Tax=Gossypium raimondii TaxID=29730 RepID=UPI00063ACD9C|nr:uncharacterized protein LOC105803065 isoform X5 [Gossypium raimondii]
MSVPLFNLAPNLTVSRLCLGTMTFGEQNSLPQTLRLLDQAFDAGINFFDSAEIIGTQFLSVLRLKGKVKNTLASGLERGKYPVTVLSLLPSLKRLQMDHIDLYQIHWPDRYVPMFGETEYDPVRQFSSVPIEEQLDALGRAVDAGKIRYIGLSNETPYGVMKFLQFAENNVRYPKIISVQVNSYSLLCRTFDSGMAECCHHERIYLLGYSPLAMGILSGKYFASDGAPSDARLNLFKGRYSEGESRYSLARNTLKLATMEYLGIAEKYGLHPVSLAIAFVLNHPLVASTVFGVTKPWQLEEVISACNVELTSEIIADINKVHAKFPNPCP